MRKVVSAPQLSALVKDTRQPDPKKDATARGIPKNLSCSFVGGSLRRSQVAFTCYLILSFELRVVLAERGLT